MFLTIIGVIIGIVGVVLMKKKLKVPAAAMMVLAIGLIGYSLLQEYVFSTPGLVSARTDASIQNAEGYATARLLKEKMPSAKAIVILGIGASDSSQGLLDGLKSNGYRDVTYVSVFQGPPMGMSKVDIAAALVDAVKGIASVDVYVAKFSVPAEFAAQLKEGQKLILFTTSVNPDLAATGAVIASLNRKPNLDSKDYPTDPKDFFEKVFDVKYYQAQP